MGSRGARVHERTEITVGVVGCGRMGCAIAGEFVRRGCTVVLYDHTEYTRNRAFQTLRASLWDHVSRAAAAAAASPRAECTPPPVPSHAPVPPIAFEPRRRARSQVANGYLLKQDVEELMGRISVSDTLAETLVKSEVRARRRT